MAALIPWFGGSCCENNAGCSGGNDHQSDCICVSRHRELRNTGSVARSAETLQQAARPLFLCRSRVGGHFPGLLLWRRAGRYPPVWREHPVLEVCTKGHEGSGFFLMSPSQTRGAPWDLEQALCSGLQSLVYCRALLFSVFLRPASLQSAGSVYSRWGLHSA